MDFNTEKRLAITKVIIELIHNGAQASVIRGHEKEAGSRRASWSFMKEIDKTYLAITIGRST